MSRSCTIQKKVAKAAAFCLAVAGLFLCSGGACSGQIWRIEASDGSLAMGFNASGYFFTAGHAPGTGLTVSDLDVRITVRKRYPFELSVGPGKPHHFFDRRGIKHRITTRRTEDLMYLVDFEFFSGESGLPVFSSRGFVCGVVSGNRVQPSRFGLVSRLDKLESSGGVILFPRGTFSVPSDEASDLSDVDAEEDGVSAIQEGTKDLDANAVQESPRIYVFPHIRK